MGTSVLPDSEPAEREKHELADWGCTGCPESHPGRRRVLANRSVFQNCIRV